jgi:phage terminase large subunit-like protein
MGLRLGALPQTVITTTPRPRALLRRIIADAATHIIRGSTRDNLINLSPAFARAVVAKYDGTRLGRQELDGELLEDVPGALWRLDDIDRSRVREPESMARVVVAIDPAATSGAGADDTGIVAVGLGQDARYYVLADKTINASPAVWGAVAVELYRALGADRIVGEANNGGDMIEHVLRGVDPRVSYRKVHATRGKQIRAEPVSALYEQGQVSHVGVLRELEDQMCTWDPAESAKSPDRVDALVWAFAELNKSKPVTNIDVGMAAGVSLWAGA